MQSKNDDKGDLNHRSLSALDLTIVPWWKLDIQIIPIVTGMCLLNFLCNGNIGNARVAGLQVALGMSDNQLPSFAEARFRVALFFASTTLAGAFSGLLANAISHLDGQGGRPGWAYIFILEGCFTIFYGILCFFVMPRSLETIGLLTPEEKTNAHAVLMQEHTLLRDDSLFSWKSIRGVFLTPHAWLTLLLGLLGAFRLAIAGWLSSISFEPSIVQSLGYEANEAQLMSVPPFAAAWAVNIITAVISDRFHLRGVTIIFHALLATIGFAIFLGSSNPTVQYGSLFLYVPGVYCQPPPLLSWTANNAAPRYRRAAALAFLLTTTDLGGILATWIFGPLSAGLNYKTATIVSIVASGVSAIAALLNILWLHSQNTRRRRVHDPGEVLDDTSIGFIYKL
ncbi:hypothetical protein VNI00_017668 [Paramarasmius palmivorus]|uniref:MFS general substrate transporter n=1 Tax=Paramarasmius palmivorus TaxID=297713 RepID=A0AAW0B521_9AGAR